MKKIIFKLFFVVFIFFLAVAKSMSLPQESYLHNNFIEINKNFNYEHSQVPVWESAISVLCKKGINRTFSFAYYFSPNLNVLKNEIGLSFFSSLSECLKSHIRYFINSRAP